MPQKQPPASTARPLVASAASAAPTAGGGTTTALSACPLPGACRNSAATRIAAPAAEAAWGATDDIRRERRSVTVISSPPQFSDMLPISHLRKKRAAVTRRDY